ncbi:hypothetical protein [Nocardioides speluncae]|uniref:hypothetical protein n=1 Tax=Nocardioides speluncae TaxID=2670337 RepID=UPI000D68E1E5|nr:hypothetical protein [Nocardioides speluncae]
MDTSSQNNDDEWLPELCPPWCTADHAAVYAESGDWVLAQLHTRSGGSDFLDEIRNPIDGRVMRRGGGEYQLRAEQEASPTGRGFLTTPVVNLRVTGPPAVAVELTTGEARSLARQLEHLADAVELS